MRFVRCVLERLSRVAAVARSSCLNYGGQCEINTAKCELRIAVRCCCAWELNKLPISSRSIYCHTRRRCHRTASKWTSEREITPEYRLVGSLNRRESLKDKTRAEVLKREAVEEEEEQHAEYRIINQRDRDWVVLGQLTNRWLMQIQTYSATI